MRRGGLYIQSEQEQRSIDAGGQSGSTRAYRFPLFSAAMPVGVSWNARAYRSRRCSIARGARRARDKQVFDADSVAFTERFRSEGALNDVRCRGFVGAS